MSQSPSANDETRSNPVRKIRQKRADDNQPPKVPITPAEQQRLDTNYQAYLHESEKSRKRYQDELQSLETANASAGAEAGVLNTSTEVALGTLSLGSPQPHTPLVAADPQPVSDLTPITVDIKQYTTAFLNFIARSMQQTGHSQNAIEQKVTQLAS